MTEPLPPGSATPGVPSGGGLSAALQEIIQSVDGVTAVYPARPLWQTIAGAARSAVSGERQWAVDVDTSGGATTVRTRIGVSGARPAPEVARAVAAAVRRHLDPGTATVNVGIVRIGADQPATGQTGSGGLEDGAAGPKT
ncbi:hypothetical protein [Arthrobacter sp. PM3]|uniref:hypothetical protein n=1 Tax=Arthrobacter sp. PM3 TaxID=2017685 RepID=UPI001ABFC600|nr:hypothetical protein [Arthrobacter sp. PM3]